MNNKRWIGIGIVGLFLLFGVALYFGVSSLSQPSGKPAKKATQIISLVKPPPPPPPEKQMEKPPEPEMQEEIDIQDPTEMPEEVPELADEPPAGDQLGLDADGSGAGDNFGLVARKGGRGLLAGDPVAWYAGRIQECLREYLQDFTDIKVTGSYSTIVRVSSNAQGRLKVALESSTAGESVKAAIATHFNQPVSCATKPPQQATGKEFRIRMIAEGRS